MPACSVAGISSPSSDFNWIGGRRLSDKAFGEALDVAGAAGLGVHVPSDGRNKLIEGSPFRLRCQRLEGGGGQVELRIGQLGRLVVVGPFQLLLKP